MKLRYGRSTDVDHDFNGIVGRTKDLHTITRSTIPLMSWWRDKADVQLLPGADLANSIARFEYSVPARCATCGGTGKPSMTDVMVHLEGQAIAIEAKYNEPKYESVDLWRSKGKDPKNRQCVLGHWCHLIEDFTSARIDRAMLGSLVYQTVHRSASACAATPPGGAARVMYMVFGRDEHAGHKYEADLRVSATVLDPQRKVQFSILTIPTMRGRDYERVAKLMSDALTDEERIDAMANALTSQCAIYEFDEPVHVRIA